MTTVRQVLMTGEQMAQIPKARTISSLPRVEGAVDIRNFSIAIVSQGPIHNTCILYKGVPLWRTAFPLDAVDIFLLPPGEEGEPHVLVLVDEFADTYTYGCWDSLEEAQEWLDKPKRLY